MKLAFCRDEVERLARECQMRLYRTSVKEDLNVSGVFQHLAENYVNKVKSFTSAAAGNSSNLSHNHVEMFQIGASSVRSKNYVTNNNSRGGPLYITKPQKIQQQPPQSRNFNKNGYIPSAYSSSAPTRRSAVIPSSVSSNYQSSYTSFSPQDYLKSPMFESLNNHHRIMHRYWPQNHDRNTITLRPLTAKKLSSRDSSSSRKMPRNACKVLS